MGFNIFVATVELLQSVPEVYCTSNLLRSFLRLLIEDLHDVLSWDLTLHLAESPTAHTCLRNLIMGELWK